jgi:hypothetical protein
VCGRVTEGNYMKLKIEKVFRDKNNGKLYSVGDTIEFDEERAAELLKDNRKLVTKVKDEKPATKKAKPKK